MNIFTHILGDRPTPSINTKENGTAEFTIFEENSTFVGVCLTFDIVVEGTNYEEVREQLIDAAKVHIETVRRNNLPVELLNRHAPAEYWEKRKSTLLTDGSEQRSFASLLALPYAGGQKITA
ncbi:MAG: hypothetical protein A3D65_06765 [Candidatus Lloydbacteria bacterium RIFCSPHIGHO2_02_FULL_50_13]|uniref:HicB-like antitoxin of toxin-antitoxin system domain-containing protein n=1 Tax=Candidatus Lloydbacteria bacterium RIFCSPHIGHO2_02_FULL_50_13 TaxID=1798661 RepID=A0A1G2CZM2_9BACT|nr:MAG: hypothetical protein A3D65_06765 [Candidatus Lloydbacteria bacterium RIFCSPHIGHO2_02_FULL_50_13]